MIELISRRPRVADHEQRDVPGSTSICSLVSPATGVAKDVSLSQERRASARSDGDGLKVAGDARPPTPTQCRDSSAPAVLDRAPARRHERRSGTRTVARVPAPRRRRPPAGVRGPGTTGRGGERRGATPSSRTAPPTAPALPRHARRARPGRRSATQALGRLGGSGRDPLSLVARARQARPARGADQRARVLSHARALSGRSTSTCPRASRSTFRRARSRAAQAEQAAVGHAGRAADRAHRRHRFGDHQDPPQAAVGEAGGRPRTRSRARAGRPPLAPWRRSWPAIIASVQPLKRMSSTSRHARPAARRRPRTRRARSRPAGRSSPSRAAAGCRRRARARAGTGGRAPPPGAARSPARARRSAATARRRPRPTGGAPRADGLGRGRRPARRRSGRRARPVLHQRVPAAVAEPRQRAALLGAHVVGRASASCPRRRAPSS